MLPAEQAERSQDEVETQEDRDPQGPAGSEGSAKDAGDPGQDRPDRGADPEGRHQPEGGEEDRAEETNQVFGAWNRAARPDLEAQSDEGDHQHPRESEPGGPASSVG